MYFNYCSVIGAALGLNGPQGQISCVLNRFMMLQSRGSFCGSDINFCKVCLSHTCSQSSAIGTRWVCRKLWVPACSLFTQVDSVHLCCHKLRCPGVCSTRARSLSWVTWWPQKICPPRIWERDFIGKQGLCRWHEGTDLGGGHPGSGWPRGQCQWLLKRVWVSLIRTIAKTGWARHLDENYPLLSGCVSLS